MLGNKVYKPIEGQSKCDEYSALAKWCNENRAMMEDKGDYYEVVAIPEPSEEEKHKSELLAEKSQLEAELKSMDYIGTKIACGRATREEYEEEITRMNECAERINAINEELKDD